MANKLHDATDGDRNALDMMLTTAGWRLISGLGYTDAGEPAGAHPEMSAAQWVA